MATELPAPDELPAQMHSKSSPVMVLAAIAAVCTVIVGVLPTIPGVPGWAVAVVGAIGAAATGLYGIYTKGLVTPWEDVVAKVTPDLRVVAGPAADAVTSPTIPVDVGDEVTVLPQAA